MKIYNFKIDNQGFNYESLYQSFKHFSIQINNFKVGDILIRKYV